MGLEFALGGLSGSLLGGVVGRTGWGGGQALGAKSGIIFIPLVMAHGPGLMMPSVPHPSPPSSSVWQAPRVTVERLGKEERSEDPFLD